MIYSLTTLDATLKQDLVVSIAEQALLDGVASNMQEALNGVRTETEIVNHVNERCDLYRKLGTEAIENGHDEEEFYAWFLETVAISN